MLIVAFSLQSCGIEPVKVWAYRSFLCIACSGWRRKLFPNCCISVLYPQVCQEPHLLQRHLQPQQHRPLVVRLHMASLAKEIYRMGQAPLFRCRGMCLGQPKISLMKLEGLGLYVSLFLFHFFFLFLSLSVRSLFLFPPPFWILFLFF